MPENKVFQGISVYSRLRFKHRGTPIDFWTFFPGATFLIRKGNPLFDGMPILRAMQ